MVSHLVLLTPRSDLTPAERAAFVDAFEHAVTGIPSVRGVRIGTRVRHGAGYEVATPDVGDYLAIIDFDDVGGLQEYLRHEAHAPLGRLFGSALSSALVYDFEMGGIERLKTLG
jgi:Stress responsive A/B Barrel Domain